MRLIDTLTPVLGYILALKKHLGQIQPTAETVRADLGRLLEEAQGQALRAGFSPADFEQAQFAVVAWLDESIMLSDWDGRQVWTEALLQRRLFGTTNAGDEFFIRLAVLTPEQIPVREVYATCLGLGFQGRYYLESQAEELAKLRTGNLETLWGGPVDDIDFALSFPEAYPPTAGAVARRRLRPGLHPLIGAIILAPPAIWLTLFAVYRLLLNRAFLDFFRLVG